MEGGRNSSEETYSEVLKMSINAFHLSIMQHGPYDLVPVSKLSWPIAVVCKWPNQEVWEHEGKRLYMLDTAALSRLQKTMKNLAVVDKGTAWPHVNFANESAAVEWLMSRDDFCNSSDTVAYIASMKWFVLSTEVGDLMDSVASLHNLAPTTAKISLSHSLLNVEAPVSLTLIILRPKGIIVSFRSSPHPDASNSISSPLPCVRTVCVADKDSLKSSQHLVTASCAGLESHCVIDQLPHHLESLIGTAQQYAVENSCLNCNVPHIGLPPETEITIKEKPLAIGGIDLEKKSNVTDCTPKPPSTYWNSSESVCLLQKRFHEQTQEENSTPTAHKSSEEAFVDRLLREQRQLKYFGRLLECPKCCATFKFGHHGRGLSLLMGHIGSHHSRAVSHCKSILQWKYADILERKKL